VPGPKVKFHRDRKNVARGFEVKILGHPPPALMASLHAD
jgi:hypothetical protein